MSAKLVYGSDWHVVTDPSAEDQEFIDAVAVFGSTILRLYTELPLYRLYENSLAREFKEAVEV